MQQHYVSPVYGEGKFNCPTCFAFAQQDWYEINDAENGFYNLIIKNDLTRIVDSEILSSFQKNGYATNNVTAISICFQCDHPSIWVKGRLVYPMASVAPLPNPDMPEDVMKLYNEAREISSLSPRASTALLRLAVELLLPQVGAKKAKIDNMISQLVGMGLPKEVEKALDSLRVIGNEAVHPGTIDTGDNSDIAIALFKVLNIVVDRLITQKKEIDELYSLIPEEKIKGINNRNSKAITPQP
ncbi:DUF4145 domain-containing protein [Lysinibacillus sp. FSL H8-0500]|uniref:DUF4145 domain-containing protein n=1 Tax=Lysinibacillus sp. FSL H8-0500 TaxID=2921393 RepID=UPI003100F9EA